MTTCESLSLCRLQERISAITDILVENLRLLVHFEGAGKTEYEHAQKCDDHL